MRFRIEQRLAAPIAVVEAALIDPGWYAAVAATDATWAPELLAAEDLGATVALRVRYRFRGHLSPAAAAVVDPSKLSWVEVSRLDRTTHGITLRIDPDHYADKLSFTGAASMASEADSEGVTVRRLDGEVRVRVPFVGGRVEGAIVSGLREHAATEEAAFGAFVTRTR